MKLITIAKILTYLFWVGDCDQEEKPLFYESWKILDDENDSIKIKSSHILAFRSDKARQHLIMMSEITEYMSNGKEQNYVMIQYNGTSYKFAEIASYNSFDVNEEKGMAYFHNSAKSPDTDGNLRIYCINYADAKMKEVKVYNITNLGLRLMAPEFGRLKVIEQTNKVVFTAKDTDSRKYICLFEENKEVGDKPSAKINCIRLRNQAWGETFIHYDDGINKSKVLFSKKADAKRITLQIIDFDYENEISYWIDTPETLSDNMPISDGYYYKYDNTDQVGYFYLFACFGQRLVLYKFDAVRDTLHLGNETYQMKLSESLTKITFIDTINDTNYCLFSSKSSNKGGSLQEEKTFLTIFSIKQNRTLVYEVNTKSNRIPLFLTDPRLHFALKDYNRPDVDKEIYYVKSTVLLESANIAVGIDYQPNITFQWLIEERVTLKINTSNPYSTVNESSAFGDSITPIFSTRIDTKNDKKNLTKNLNLAPKYIDIKNGDKFFVDATPDLEIDPIVELCDKKNDLKKDKHCDQFICTYHKNKTDNNLECEPKKILESPKDFRTYFDNKYSLSGFDKNTYYQPILISQSQCVNGCKKCEKLDDPTQNNDPNIQRKCSKCYTEIGYIKNGENICVPTFYYFIKYSQYVLTPVLTLLWALSWKQEYFNFFKLHILHYQSFYLILFITFNMSIWKTIFDAFIFFRGLSFPAVYLFPPAITRIPEKTTAEKQASVLGNIFNIIICSCFLLSSVSYFFMYVLRLCEKLGVNKLEPS
ncbi:unnamed protein product [Moneuplotes crassus]|uniref:Uncharacterized protein n=1 Tax=Euplotes crassus TaxID=5936 RepID=A0AAD1XZT2_EUPCR|nr:unnamed protein product [Moneuplotes crassus]